MCVFLHFLLFALNQEGEGVHANTTVVQLLLLVQTLSLLHIQTPTLNF